MPCHRECREVGLPPDRVFDLIADVEHYVEFLPSWQGVRVVGHEADGYDTEQTVGVGMLAHRFQTHTSLERPRAIVVTSNDRVFSRFVIRWEFAPTPAGGCRIDFALDFAVCSWLLAPTVEMLIVPTASSMVSAFERRAHQLATADRTLPAH